MPQPTILHGLLASQVVIDRTTNYATIVNTIDEVGVPSEVLGSLKKGSRAIAHGEMVLYLLLSWDWPDVLVPGQATLGIRLRTAGGYVGKATEVTTNTGVPSVRSRLLVHVQGFPVDIPGIYTFEVLQDDEVAYRVPFAVKAVDASASSPTAGQAAPASSATAANVRTPKERVRPSPSKAKRHK